MTADLKIGRTVVRTVQLEFSAEEIAEIVLEHVKRTNRVQLRDFTLTVGYEDGFVVIKGEARTEGMAQTRKRK